MKHNIKPAATLPSTPKPEVKRVQTPVSLSFKQTLTGTDFCLSNCTSAEVREMVDCLRMLTTLSWQQVLQTAGKGKNKAGLAYTPYPDNALKKVTRPNWLSEDVRISAVRASQKMRIFGAYVNHIFYVLWFDREHLIVPV